MPSTPVAIIDQQPLTRLGAVQLIQSFVGMEVVFTGPSVGDLLKQPPEHIGMVIYDYARANGNGVKELSILRETYPGVRILIISDESDKVSIHRMLEQGIHGFLTKHCSEEETRNAISAIGHGDKFFCNKILDLILEKHYTPPAEDCEPTSLSERELEIVSLIAAGRKTKQIASDLNLSEHTIYTHRKNIMRKLQVNSAQELIVHAMQTGLVQVG